MTDENPKIDIPEELQEICREFGKVANKYGLIEMSGRFRHRTHWGGDITFGWTNGRHGVGSNEIRISSTFNVFTKIIEP